MDIKAFKMDGLGNDFVIIDNRQKVTELSKEQIIKICDRNFIGCDQLIFIEKDNTADARVKFFNSDGGESGACGNGTRCVANLISKENGKNNIILTTLSRNLKSLINSFAYILNILSISSPHPLLRKRSFVFCSILFL